MQKAARKAARKDKPPKKVTKALNEPVPHGNKGMIVRQMERIVATTDDPSEREHARRYLESL